MAALVRVGMIVAMATVAIAWPRTAAADSPVGISIISPLKIPPSTNAEITGVSFNLIYGHSKSVRGIEVGLINRARERFAGIQLGAMNAQDGRKGSAACVLCFGVLGNLHMDVSGIQAGFFNFAGKAGGVLQVGLFNHIERDAGFALQIAFMNFNNVLPAGEGEPAVWHSGKQKGIQLSAGNVADNYSGLQVGAVVNMVRGQFKGIQLSALINAAEYVKGAQIAAFNYGTEVHGLQFGLVNMARKLHGVQIGALNIAWKNTLPAMVLVNAGF